MTGLEPMAVSLRTRGTELDHTGFVSMTAFLRYFEHTRWTAMMDPRLALVDAVHAGHFFVVHNQIVSLVRAIGQTVDLTLTTRFLQAGRCTALVYHEAIRADDGAVVARAKVKGVWIGPNRRIARLPEAFVAFGRAQAAEMGPIPPPPERDPGAEPNGSGQARSFFTPPTLIHPAHDVDIDIDIDHVPRGAVSQQRTVRPSERDIFSHVNAATWLTFFDDLRHDVAATGRLGPTDHVAGHNVRTALLYRREAVRGDRLTIHGWPVGHDPGHLAFAATLGDVGELLCCGTMATAPGAAAISPHARASP